MTYTCAAWINMHMGIAANVCLSVHLPQLDVFYPYFLLMFCFPEDVNIKILHNISETAYRTRSGQIIEIKKLTEFIIFINLFVLSE
jgi:hypothetical protein